MELYIEKEFLDNFYLEFDDNNNSNSQKILFNILKDYAEVDWFINCKIENQTDLEKLKMENPFFSFRALYSSPISINSVKEHFFNNSKCTQTLIFTQKEEVWFEEAQNKGAICFSYGDYQSKIENIISNFHIKIDLSDKFNGWDFIIPISGLPFNKIIINDGYILVDKTNQKIADNIIPIFKNLLNQKYQKDVNIEIYTKDFNPQKPGTDNQINEIVQFKLRNLNRVFSNYNSTKIKIISTNVGNGFDFHDRLIYLNFLMIDCPKGFNLIPHKNSNSQIIVDSIFDKYTYDRLRKHLKQHYTYFEYLKKIESLSFKYTT